METMVSQISRGQGHEFLNKLEATGLNNMLAQRVIDSKGNELATKVVGFIRDAGFEPMSKNLTSLNPQWLRAREIMERNFFGVEEAIKHFGVNPTRQQVSALSEIPFSEAVLEQSKDTHVLVAVFPLSILEIRGKVKDVRLSNAQVLLAKQDWYDKEPFAKKRSKVIWQLVRKTPVDDSISKNWSKQQVLLGKDDEVPSAQVMIYTIIGHFLATGERLFEHIYVRTSSVGSDGVRVRVGFFDSRGLGVDRCWGGLRGGRLGVSSARKF